MMTNFENIQHMSKQEFIDKFRIPLHTMFCKIHNKKCTVDECLNKCKGRDGLSPCEVCMTEWLDEQTHT